MDVHCGNYMLAIVSTMKRTRQNAKGCTLALQFRAASLAHPHELQEPLPGDRDAPLGQDALNALGVGVAT